MGQTGGPQPAAPQTRFSADWAWWWDGAEWKPAVSPDGLWRWNGQGWVPAASMRPSAARSGGGIAAGIVITLVLFVAVIGFVSIIVIVVLLTMGNQIANVFSNVTAALGP